MLTSSAKTLTLNNPPSTKQQINKGSNRLVKKVKHPETDYVLMSWWRPNQR